MRLIAFIADGAEVRKILEHIGVDSQAPHITPACGWFAAVNIPVGPGAVSARLFGHIADRR